MHSNVEGLFSDILVFALNGYKFEVTSIISVIPVHKFLRLKEKLDKLCLRIIIFSEYQQNAMLLAHNIIGILHIFTSFF